jgi:hypothetical protein
MREFGYDNWSACRAVMKEAKHAYAGVMSYRAIAKGRKRDSSGCIYFEAVGEDPSVNAKAVFEQYSYVRFVGDETIWRYRNEAEMIAQIKLFDDLGETDLDEGDTFVLEPMNTARSREYADKRRQAISDGKWDVKPRGPNPNMRRLSIHHNRPY